MRPFRGNDWFDPFKKGNRNANTHFVLVYSPVLLHHARMILRGDSVSEEIVMDSFLKAWKSRNRFNDIKHLRRFLYLVTTRACLAYLRSVQRQRQILKEYSYFTEATAKTPAIDSEYPVRYTGLLRAINSLPALNRNILQLCVVEGRSNGEAASILRISTRMVTYRKYQVLQSLRNHARRSAFP
jgi:RNA polymerase sigma-70 factor (ECF subfamily)